MTAAIIRKLFRSQYIIDLPSNIQENPRKAAYAAGAVAGALYTAEERGTVVEIGVPLGRPIAKETSA